MRLCTAAESNRVFRNKIEIAIQVDYLAVELTDLAIGNGSSPMGNWMIWDQSDDRAAVLNDIRPSRHPLMNVHPSEIRLGVLGLQLDRAIAIGQGFTELAHPSTAPRSNAIGWREFWIALDGLGRIGHGLCE